ncbi:C69 family dipeptidase [Candidatus Aerophobetes bacterium]|nr:C69 family dipeptidase [Candidatus Aerophobetes bacterium]
MKPKRLFLGTVLVLTLSFALVVVSFASCSSCKKGGCSSFAAGKLATVSGCTMSGHTCDGNCDFTLKVVPGGTHKSGEMYRIEWPGLPGGFGHEIKTEIPQAPVTYTYFQIECPIGNEHQVFFGENTCGTKEELQTLSAEEGLIDWTQAAALALQRGKTAREAIKALGEIIGKYGLGGAGGLSCGESFLITDPNEAWCMEIPGYTNEWVAERIPDDQVCPHANRMRIGEIDLSNPDYFMASPNLIKNAQEKGLYDPEKDGPFNFEKIYNTESNRNSWGNRRREWRMLSLLCPSKKWDPNALIYPFSVKPDKKISPQWWINNIWRDHLEGTPYDLTKGIPAGPFGCPERPSISDITFERNICIPRTSYSWVSQARSWLPDWIGGVIWFGLDCPHSSCYVPFYVGISQTPKSWRTGDFTKFSKESARWYFQALDNYSCLRFNEMNADVRAVFDRTEDIELAMQPYIDKAASELYKIDPALAQRFLTNFSGDCALKAENEARDLFYSLIAKYADGKPRTTVNKEWMEILKKYTVPVSAQ